MVTSFPDFENVPQAFSVHDLARTAAIDARTAKKRLIAAGVRPVVITGPISKPVRLFLLKEAWPALIRQPLSATNPLAQSCGADLEDSL
jgi:hypothetical protein